MQALMVPMVVPRSAGKLRVQVASVLVSQNVPAKGAIIAMKTSCQYEGSMCLQGILLCY